jgi:hypothetical protein
MLCTRGREEEGIWKDIASKYFASTTDYLCLTHKSVAIAAA